MKNKNVPNFPITALWVGRKCTRLRGTIMCIDIKSMRITIYSSNLVIYFSVFGTGYQNKRCLKLL